MISLRTKKTKSDFRQGGGACANLPLLHLDEKDAENENAVGSFFAVEAAQTPEVKIGSRGLVAAARGALR